MILLAIFGCSLFSKEYVCCENGQVTTCDCPYFETCDPPPMQVGPDGSCEIEDTGTYLDDSGDSGDSGCDSGC